MGITSLFRMMMALQGGEHTRFWRQRRGVDAPIPRKLQPGGAARMLVHPARFSFPPCSPAVTGVGDIELPHQVDGGQGAAPAGDRVRRLFSFNEVILENREWWQEVVNTCF